MEMKSESGNGSCVLSLEGEMSIYDAHGLKAALMDALANCDVLDVNLADVTEIDTAGIQLLVLAKREAEARGKRLSLTGHSPAVVSVIELLNLSGYFGDQMVIPGGRGAA